MSEPLQTTLTDPKVQKLCAFISEHAGHHLRRLSKATPHTLAHMHDEDFLAALLGLVAEYMEEAGDE